MPRSIKQQYHIDASPEQVFRALITPSAIRQWWDAARAIVIPEPGGVYAVAWGPEEDAPDYISVSTLAVYDPPNELRFTDFRYLSSGGALPFEPALDLRFRLEAAADGTLLRLEQTGFPEEAVADDFYHACVQGWQDTMRKVQLLSFS